MQAPPCNQLDPGSTTISYLTTLDSSRSVCVCVDAIALNLYDTIFFIKDKCVSVAPISPNHDT